MTSIDTDTPFVVNSASPIGFGKLKGKPHSAFLLTDNKKYSQWIIDQGEDFRYKATREYIISNMDNAIDYEIEKAIKFIKDNQSHKLVKEFYNDIEIVEYE